MNRTENKFIKDYNKIIIPILVAIIITPFIVFRSEDDIDYDIFLNKMMEWNMNLLIGVLLALIISVIFNAKIKEYKLKESIKLWMLYSFLILFLLLLSMFDLEEGFQKTLIIINIGAFTAIIFYVKDLLFKLIGVNKK